MWSNRESIDKRENHHKPVIDPTLQASLKQDVRQYFLLDVPNQLAIH